MLPRRSRNTTPNYASQQQVGSSVGVGRQPDQVTDHVAPRGPAIQAFITESPVSSTPALDTPTPTDPLKPEPKRQPTQRKIDGSFNPTSQPTPPQPELGPTRYETTGVSGGIHGGVWPIYNKVSQEFDEKGLKQWNDDLDVLLIFVSLLVRVTIRSGWIYNHLQAALFSAIVTAFLIRALDDLDPNYQQQSALLLHQLLNGRDPNLADISDPTIPQRPTNSAIAVNCLWFASLLTSLGASLCAIICKGWLTEYTSGTNPVGGLLRACRRHIRFVAFRRLNVHTLVSFLPVLLHSSVLLFFAGAVVYLLQMDKRVAIVFVITGGVLGAAYFTLAILPFVTNPPFRHYSTFLFYRLFAATGLRRVVMPIADMFVHICYLTLRYAIRVILLLKDPVIIAQDALREFPFGVKMSLPEYKYKYLQQANARHDLLDQIDTSQKIQEEAILWLSQVPLDPPDSKILISSLVLISSTHPSRFGKPAIMFLNLVLEASLRKGGGREETDVAIDCVIVLGNIKFQSVVDRNLDRDHNVGEIPVPPSVAWAAQKLLTDAQKANSGTSCSDGIRERLLAATAWLSPVRTEVAEWDGGENLRIQGRGEFLKEIWMALDRHLSGENPLHTKDLVALIRGMHACFPRGDYGKDLPFVSFLLSFCEDYASPWSEDEGVLRALVTYTLDLLLPPGEPRQLVEREVGLEDLTSELIDSLTANPYYFDAACLGFWLMCRVPDAFRSRTAITKDIDRIWLESRRVLPGNLHELLNIQAIRALATVVKHQVVNNRDSEYPCHTNLTDLTLPSVALESYFSRPTAAYAISMILNLSPPTEISPPIGRVSVESIIDTLFPPDGGDIERTVVEEDVIDSYIYLTRILLKLSPTPELDVGRLVGLIARVEKMIEAPFTQESEAAERSEVESQADLGQARWKAVYLSALLLKLVPDDQTEEHKERLRVRVQELLESGELSPADDCRHFPQPLDMYTPESRADQQEQGYTVFETWIRGFPFLPVTKMSLGWETLLEMSLGWGTLQGMSPW